MAIGLVLKYSPQWKFKRNTHMFWSERPEVQFSEYERRIWQSVDVLDQVVVQAMAEVKAANKVVKVAMVVVAEGIDAAAAVAAQ